MAGRTRAPKRPRGFSAASFSAALSTRLRSTTDSLLECIGQGSSSIVCLEQPNLGKVRRLNSTFSRSADTSSFTPPPPGPLLEVLLPPLAQTSSLIGATARASSTTAEAWPLVQPPASNSRKPLGYKEYLVWLRMVLPEQVDPYRLEADDPTGPELMEQLRAKLEAQRLGPPPLTAEEKASAAEALDNGDPQEVVVSKFSVDLTRSQLSCLAPCSWLNDEVVNFYCKLLQERCDQAHTGPSCWFTNTFFWPKLAGQDGKTYSYKDVKRWTIRAKVDIFQKDYVIFPMNMNRNDHWATGVINLRDKCFHYLDSLNLSPPKSFVNFLQQYLNDEHQSKHSSALSGAGSWTRVELEVPQQTNGYDCGVFTCCVAESLSSGRRDFDFSQDDMDMMRFRLAARIVSGGSLWTT
mmetsp:Transcript_31323/g.57426  ORF Transcript_31323/g.57426 Transcript_31323/m.57426 type:complete len:408 (-) Transcript_31323:23-1246(-)